MTLELMQVDLEIGDCENKDLTAVNTELFRS